MEYTEHSNTSEIRCTKIKFKELDFLPVYRNISITGDRLWLLDKSGDRWW